MNEVKETREQVRDVWRSAQNPVYITMRKMSELIQNINYIEEYLYDMKSCLESGDIDGASWRCYTANDELCYIEDSIGDVINEMIRYELSRNIR